MSKIENATTLMERFANDPGHGYDQQYRWGEKGDFDCSSAIIYAWEFAGVPVRSSGATYTGNMYSVFLSCGFEDVTDLVDLSSGVGLQRGDVLLNHVNHTAMCCGNGRTVEASINEYGTTTGGEPGDQTGKEFLIRTYRNFPWDCVLRFTEKPAESAASGMVGAGNSVPTYFYTVRLPLLKKGHTGPYVKALQELLISKGFLFDEADGVFGVNTESAVSGFQHEHGLDPDGEVGGLTWAKVMGG